MMARADVSVERKTQILDAAAAVFASKGFHQARMDDIVSESGLSKGAIYWYFKSKNDLVMAIAERFFDQEMGYLADLLSDKSQSVAQRLQRANHHFVESTLHARDLLPLFYEFYALGAREETVRPFFRKYIQGFRAVLVPLFQEGIERGELRPVNPEAAFLAYSAMFEGLVLLWTTAMDRHTVDLHPLAQQTIDVLLAGLLVPESIPTT
jgi:AcrR family transcriptional regulator